MNDAERLAYAQLSDVVEVVRGFARKDGEQGFSWTMSEAVARHFAQQAAGYEGATEPRVAYGMVRREDVVCVLQRRGEDEVVVRPGSVTITRVEPLVDVERRANDSG